MCSMVEPRAAAFLDRIDTVALLTGRLHIPTFNIEASVGLALAAAGRGSPIRMALPYVKDGESAVHLRSHLNSLLRL